MQTYTKGLTWDCIWFAWLVGFKVCVMSSILSTNSYLTGSSVLIFELAILSNRRVSEISVHVECIMIACSRAQPTVTRGLFGRSGGQHMEHGLMQYCLLPLRGRPPSSHSPIRAVVPSIQARGPPAAAPLRQSRQIPLQTERRQIRPAAGGRGGCARGGRGGGGRSARRRTIQTTPPPPGGPFPAPQGGATRPPPASTRPPPPHPPPSARPRPSPAPPSPAPPSASPSRRPPRRPVAPAARSAPACCPAPPPLTGGYALRGQVRARCRSMRPGLSGLSKSHSLPSERLFPKTPLSPLRRGETHVPVYCTFII